MNFPAFKNKKYTAYGNFYRNGPYGKIPTKEEPISFPESLLRKNQSKGLDLPQDYSAIK